MPLQTSTMGRKPETKFLIRPHHRRDLPLLMEQETMLIPGVKDTITYTIVLVEAIMVLSFFKQYTNIIYLSGLASIAAVVTLRIRHARYTYTPFSNKNDPDIRLKEIRWAIVIFPIIFIVGQSFKAVVSPGGFAHGNVGIIMFLAAAFAWALLEGFLRIRIK